MACESRPDFIVPLIKYKGNQEPYGFWFQPSLACVNGDKSVKPVFDIKFASSASAIHLEDNVVKLNKADKELALKIMQYFYNQHKQYVKREKAI